MDRRTLNEYLACCEADDVDMNYDRISRTIGRISHEEMEELIEVILYAAEWEERRAPFDASQRFRESAHVPDFDSAPTSLFGIKESDVDRDRTASDVLRLGDTELQVCRVESDITLECSRVVLTGPEGKNYEYHNQVQTIKTPLDHEILHEIMPLMKMPIRAVLLLGQLCRASAFMSSSWEYLRSPEISHKLLHMLGIQYSVNLTDVEECIQDWSGDLHDIKPWKSIVVSNGAGVELACCLLGKDFVAVESYILPDKRIVRFPSQAEFSDLVFHSGAKIENNMLYTNYRGLMWGSLVPYLLMLCGVSMCPDFDIFPKHTYAALKGKHRFIPSNTRRGIVDGEDSQNSHTVRVNSFEGLCSALVFP